MNKMILFGLLLVITLSLIITGKPAYADTPGITVYVVPSISDTRILSDTAISAGLVSRNIAVAGCKGEYLSASFVVNSPGGLTGITAMISDIIGPATIDKSAIDMRVVKVWWQAGDEVWDIVTPTLVPELLLKDDSLISVGGNAGNPMNYARLTDNSQIWISDPSPDNRYDPAILAADLSIQDASTLQAFDIPAGTNKQLWITLKIPDAATPGTYTGTITLSQGIGVINISLTVLAFALLPPNIFYSIYYEGRLNTAGAAYVDSYLKSDAQYVAELANMASHGITNPTCYQEYAGFIPPLEDTSLFTKALGFRATTGFGGKPLYYCGLEDTLLYPDQAVATITAATTAGISSVYFFGRDEARGQTLLDQIPAWQAIRAIGGKILFSGNATAPIGETFTAAGTSIDLYNSPGVPSIHNPSTTEAALWHEAGRQICDFANPMMGREWPGTFRKNNGLVLWQVDYDGTMNFAYQWGCGKIWNDFDHSVYRDHVMAYPTIDGVIDTVQWEGFRQGVNDVRYLTTLKAAITTAKAAGKNTSAAETWLANLKSSNLTTLNLDSVRTNMINYILALQTTVVDHITVTPSNPSIAVSGTQQFSAQGYDSSNNLINGLNYTWSVTNAAAGSINSSGLFTAGTTAGSFSNVIQAVSGGKTGTASITITASQFAQGDVNMDGSVSILDMILVGQHEAESGISGWRREDVNVDGVINVLDRIVIGQNWTG